MPTKKMPTFATAEMLEALAAPTPKDAVKTKPGRGGSGQLSFIDARFVFDRFDAALGPHLWQLLIEWSPPVHSPEIATRNGKVLYPEWTTSYPLTKIGVLCEGGWVWKQDIGDFSDIEPVKGVVSDSVKRTAVQWGVGRDLYNPESEARQPDKPAQTEKAERAVVGQTGLTDKQRGLLFAKIKEAGVTGDQRKALAFLVVQKHSIKDLTNEDLETLLAFLDAPRSENADVWENILLASAE